MKQKLQAKNVLTVVCSVVGVGFLSGNEVTAFIGGGLNAVIFAVIFAILLILASFYAKNNEIDGIGDFCSQLKCKNAVYFLLLACNFVTAIAITNGYQSAMEGLFDVATKLPYYSAILLVFCLLMSRKRPNGISNLYKVTFLAVLLYYAFCITNCGKTAVKVPKVSVIKPTVYALFSAVLTLGVVFRLKPSASECTASSLTILALLLVTLTALSHTNTTLTAITESPLKKTITVLAMTLTSVTGVTATTVPIITELTDVTDDKNFSALCVYIFTLTFSCFGASTIKIGYPAVAVFGVFLLILAILQNKRHCKAVS